MVHTCVYVCGSLQLVGMESRLVELEASHKELTDHKYRSQAAIRELKAKLKSSEEVSHTQTVHRLYGGHLIHVDMCTCILQGCI